MGKGSFKKWGWVALYSLMICFAAGVSFAGAFKEGNLETGWLLSSGIVGALGAIIAFWRGVSAHEHQTDLLESQLSLVNKIWDLLSTEERALQPAMHLTQAKCLAYVRVLLYAMYQSYKKESFDYKVIDSENPNLVKLFILAISAAVNSSVLLCYIGDDDHLVVNTFNSKALTVITDGRVLINEYSHFKMGGFVKQSVHEINQACNIKESYSLE